MGSMTVKQIAQSYADVSGTLTAPTEGAGALSHDGTRAYSYGVVIAKKTGNKTCALTSRKYSVTTSRHVNLIERALLAAGYTVSGEVL